MLPVKIWVSASGPNPWKPVLVLEELGVPFQLELLHWTKLHSPEFKKINPNGKVPAMHDPNTDVTIWESGAIILYLVEQYDKEGRLTYKTLKEKHLLNQWLMYQMSQQGPYYGQASWFMRLHPEKIPSAIERYQKQMDNILVILDSALEGREWLVGDKMTYADMSFFMWNAILPIVFQCGEEETPVAKFPNVVAWHKRMAAREAFKRTMATRAGMMAKEGLGPDGLPAGINVNEMMNKLQEA